MDGEKVEWKEVVWGNNVHTNNYRISVDGKKDIDLLIKTEKS